MRLALMSLLLAACGPSYWQEQEDRANSSGSEAPSLLDQTDEDAEEPWVPPGTHDIDPEVGLSWEDFVDAFADRYCEAWEICYAYEYPSCQLAIEDIFLGDGEDCDYDIEEGPACVLAFEESGCNGIYDIGGVDECDRLLSECTVGA